MMVMKEKRSRDAKRDLLVRQRFVPEFVEIEAMKMEHEYSGNQFEFEFSLQRILLLFLLPYLVYRFVFVALCLFWLFMCA